MWASSRMGLLGFRVSLARTATKEDCIEIQFSAEGRVTPLCGLYWGLRLDRIRFLISVPKHGI